MGRQKNIAKLSRQKNIAKLSPINSSAPLGGIKPRDMTALRLSGNQKRFVQEVALGVFADMTNAGKTFQDALAAIYLSGVVHAQRDAATPPETPHEQ